MKVSVGVHGEEVLIKDEFLNLPPGKWPSPLGEHIVGGGQVDIFRISDEWNAIVSRHIGLREEFPVYINSVRLLVAYLEALGKRFQWTQLPTPPEKVVVSLEVIKSSNLPTCSDCGSVKHPVGAATYKCFNCNVASDVRRLPSFEDGV